MSAGRAGMRLVVVREYSIRDARAAHGRRAPRQRDVVRRVRLGARRAAARHWLPVFTLSKSLRRRVASNDCPKASGEGYAASR
jgi:hypothetical protein